MMFVSLSVCPTMAAKLVIPNCENPHTAVIGSGTSTGKLTGVIDLRCPSVCHSKMYSKACCDQSAGTCGISHHTLALCM